MVEQKVWLMIIGITGATGFIGSRVAALAIDRGYSVIRFSRKPASKEREISLNCPPDLSGLDALVNLAGEPVFGIWSSEKKHRIQESRVLGTRRLVEGITKPLILISASAIGYYGDTKERVTNEASAPGNDFLAEVCKEWEAEALKAQSLGCRVVLIRTGFVLGHGGSLKIMAPIFRIRLGGKLGNGRQWMSPIHVDDVAGIILWALENDRVSGPVNAVMPDPVRNEDFTDALAHTLHRQPFLPAPAFAMRLVLGEFAQMILASSRIAPQRASELGYAWKYQTLNAALSAALK